ncbi:MAG TPA: hypothetical protein VJ792_03045 [Candidatus Nitrosotalea sp.]|nr:hypothetical protein [Candidatus Nitrosotalea sp.]
MSKILLNSRKAAALTYAAAAATVIAGIMHILMAPSSITREAGEGVLFLVGGLLQVFWAVPVVKQWGRLWQAVGIGGTAVFMILWFATHTHGLFGSQIVQHNIMQGGNLTTQGALDHGFGGGRFHGGPPPRGIASIPQIEYFQAAFIVLYGTLAFMMSKSQKGKDTSKNSP